MTLSGFNFGTDQNDVSVTIHGVECTLKSVQDDEIICETERYEGILLISIRALKNENYSILSYSSELFLCIHYFELY